MNDYQTFPRSKLVVDFSILSKDPIFLVRIIMAHPCLRYTSAICVKSILMQSRICFHPCKSNQVSSKFIPRHCYIKRKHKNSRHYCTQLYRMFHKLYPVSIRQTLSTWLNEKDLSEN